MSGILLRNLYAGFEDMGQGIISENTIFVMAYVDGNEGFGDSIAKGAKVAIDFLKKVIEAIMDAAMFWMGGRSNVIKQIDRIKQSKLMEVFRPKMDVLIDKYAKPAVALASQHVDGAINEDYQAFFRKELPSSPAINDFFVSVNKVIDLLADRARSTNRSPSEKDLDFSEIMAAAKSAMDAGNKIVAAIEKEDEPNKEVLAKLNSAVTKIGKGINVLANASESIARKLEKVKEEDKE